MIGVHRQVATLQPVARTETLCLPESVPGVLMSFRHGRSQIIGLKGELRCGDDPDDVRFRVTDGVHVPRRRSSRLKLCAPTYVTAPDGAEIVCQTYDVGPDGVILEGATGLQVDQVVVLSLLLPESPEPVLTNARVTELHDGALSSLGFVDVGRDTQRRLTDFVTEHFRRRLKFSGEGAEALAGVGVVGELPCRPEPALDRGPVARGPVLELVSLLVAVMPTSAPSHQPSALAPLRPLHAPRRPNQATPHRTRPLSGRAGPARRLHRRRQISRNENGRVTPSLDGVARLAQALDVSLDYLVFDDQPRRPLYIDDRGLAERLAALAELNPEDRASLLSVLDALLTRTRVRALANDAR